MPKVSVLTPLYNPPETYLREMIDSILNQSLSDFEFILLNDCPDDTHTDDIVASYHDERIVYLKNQTNLGIAASRNKLIDLAKSDYLAVVDHDDVSLHTRLKKEADFLDAHPNCGVVSSWYQKIYGKRNLVRKRPQTNDEIVEAMRYGCAVIHPAAMLRKSVLNQFHIRYEQDFSPAEDYALFARLIGKTEFYNLQEVLLLYRNFSGNTSHQKRQQMHDNDARIKTIIEQKRLLKADVMRQIHAVNDDLKSLIRKGKKDFFLKKQNGGFGKTSALNLVEKKIGAEPNIERIIGWPNIDIGQFLMRRTMVDWSEKWKKMLNFRL